MKCTRRNKIVRFVVLVWYEIDRRHDGDAIVEKKKHIYRNKLERLLFWSIHFFWPWFLVHFHEIKNYLNRRTLCFHEIRFSFANPVFYLFFLLTKNRTSIKRINQVARNIHFEFEPTNKPKQLNCFLYFHFIAWEIVFIICSIYLEISDVFNLPFFIICLSFCSVCSMNSLFSFFLFSIHRCSSEPCDTSESW